MIGDNAHPPNHSADLSVDKELLRQAKELETNLSATLETELAPTIAAWNAFHAEHGSAADDYLDF